MPAEVQPDEETRDRGYLTDGPLLKVILQEWEKPSENGQPPKKGISSEELAEIIRKVTGNISFDAKNVRDILQGKRKDLSTLEEVAEGLGIGRENWKRLTKFENCTSAELTGDQETAKTRLIEAIHLREIPERDDKGNLIDVPSYIMSEIGSGGLITLAAFDFGKASWKKISTAAMSSGVIRCHSDKLVVARQSVESMVASVDMLYSAMQSAVRSIYRYGPPGNRLALAKLLADDIERAEGSKQHPAAFLSCLRNSKLRLAVGSSLSSQILLNATVAERYAVEWIVSTRECRPGLKLHLLEHPFSQEYAEWWGWCAEQDLTDMRSLCSVFKNSSSDAAQANDILVRMRDRLLDNLIAIDDLLELGRNAQRSFRRRHRRNG